MTDVVECMYGRGRGRHNRDFTDASVGRGQQNVETAALDVLILVRHSQRTTFTVMQTLHEKSPFATTKF